MLDFFRSSLDSTDPAVADLIQHEVERQGRKLILIPSESQAPQAVRQALGSVFQNIYAEGYPDPSIHGDTQEEILDYEEQLAQYRRYSDLRYYRGVEYVNVLESLARRRAAEAAAARANNNSSGAARSSAAAGLPAVTTRGVVCPVAGNTYFIDTWGAARPGGRTHKGVDMSGASGTPLVAMNSGKVRLNWHSAGGRQVYVYSDDGNFYYYAHLSGYAAGLSNGDRVAKGELVGYMGATGNASVSHLHLGMGRIGGAYVNPYPTVRAAC